MSDSDDDYARQRRDNHRRDRGGGQDDAGMAPGKVSLTEMLGNSPRGRLAGGSTPGKQTLTEGFPRGGPAAHDAIDMMYAPGEGGAGGGGGICFESSKSVAFNQGNVHISETVTCAVSVTHGNGPTVSFNLDDGSLSVGSDRYSVDFKSASAVRGKALRVDGGSISIKNNGTTTSKAKVEDGYAGAEVETEWELKHGDWTANISISAFVGVKPPHKPWYDDIPGVAEVAGVIAGVIAAVKASAPEWAPVLEAV